MRALLDSGSIISAISGEWFRRNRVRGKWNKVDSDANSYITAGNTGMKIAGMVPVKVSVGQFTWKIKVRIIEDLATDCILGTDFITKSRLVLETAERCFYFKFRPETRFSFEGRNQDTSVTNSVSLQNERQVESIQVDDIQAQLVHLDDFLRKGVGEICDEFKDVLTEKLGSTNLVQYKIELTDEVPVKRAPFRLSPPRMKELRQHIDKMLDQGVIRPSKSPYAAPIFLVPKSSGEYRPVVDYRELNKKVVLRSVPLPDLHSCFGWFRGARYFTTLDLNQAYNQIPLEEKSKQVTAFTTDWNLYEFNRVPFGLATGAAVLSQLMDMVFSDVKFRFVYHYLDDLVVYSRSANEHLQHLREVFNRLRRAGLTVNPNKVVFAGQKMKFLGHLVSGEGVTINPERVEVVKHYPRPRNVKEVARFIGMANFFRKFVNGFAEKAAPLNQLRKKDVQFSWGPTQEAAFTAIKEALQSAPVLALPDFSQEFILQTDASGHGLGAVLLQEQDGKRVIAYASRGLNELEQKYSIYELEALAVLYGMEAFKYYLEHREFLLETDNKALSWVLARPRKTGRIARWATRILAFKFRVNSIRSSENVVADSLSRMWSEDEGERDPKSLDREVEEPSAVASILTQIPQLFRNIKEFQDDDAELMQIKDRLKSGEAIRPYSIRNAVLCCQSRRGGQWRIVVPKDLVPLLFKYFHESPVGGHLGVFKTREKIRQHFIWQGMDNQIRKYVRNCEICAQSKPNQNSRVGFLASKTVDQPLEKMYIDFVGPLPRSKEGNRFILVCIDAFTRFVWLIPTGSATTKIVIKKLRGIFGTFGPPGTLVSDNATTFTSEEFSRFCHGLGIKHITTTPYYPNPSYAERMNRNLRSALIAYHHKDHSLWDRSLPWLTLAFNTAKHETHLSTPARLLLGYSIRTPLSNLWSVDDLLPDRITPEQVIRQWRRARDNIRRAHQQQAQRYNAGRQPNQYRVGDRVFVRNFSGTSKASEKRTKKLMLRYTGPFEIVEFLTPVSVRLKDLKTSKEVRAHVTQMKPGPQ